MQRGGGTVDETIMLRHVLDGLSVYVHDSATSSGEAKDYLRDNPEIRLALLDDGMQNLALMRYDCGTALLPCILLAGVLHRVSLRCAA
jgi:hypothetical protein